LQHDAYPARLGRGSVVAFSIHVWIKMRQRNSAEWMSVTMGESKSKIDAGELACTSVDSHQASANFLPVFCDPAFTVHIS
jgi:hypothetical protein